MALLLRSLLLLFSLSFHVGSLVPEVILLVYNKIDLRSDWISKKGARFYMGGTWITEQDSVKLRVQIFRTKILLWKSGFLLKKKCVQ